jgi:tetratricopeptide (TPR) repeat protein
MHELSHSPSGSDAYLASIDDLAANCSRHLAELPDLIRDHAAPLEAGATLGELKGMARDDYEALFASVVELYAQERFAEASSIAMMLAAHQPRVSAYSTAAGMCCEKLGDHRSAAALYAAAHIARPDGATLLRLAASMEACGETEHALAGFEEARSIAMTAGDDEIAVEASDRAQALRARGVSR